MDEKDRHIFSKMEIAAELKRTVVEGLQQRLVGKNVKLVGLESSAEGIVK